jgi:hypothetical protein
MLDLRTLRQRGVLLSLEQMTAQTDANAILLLYSEWQHLRPIAPLVLWRAEHALDHRLARPPMLTLVLATCAADDELHKVLPVGLFILDQPMSTLSAS